MLFAPDPTFYDPTLVTDVTARVADPSHVHTTLSYTGTWLSYPIIEIDGPIEDPSIYNPDNGEKLALTYHVAEGETVTIDTSYGKKTVKNGAGTNLIGYLTSNSDLATFHIQHENISGYANIYTISGTVPAGKTAHVTFKYYNRFIGI